jgi:hypothetical protein
MSAQSRGSRLRVPCVGRVPLIKHAVLHSKCLPFRQQFNSASPFVVKTYVPTTFCEKRRVKVTHFRFTFACTCYLIARRCGHAATHPPHAHPDRPSSANAHRLWATLTRRFNLDPANTVSRPLHDARLRNPGWVDPIKFPEVSIQVARDLEKLPPYPVGLPNRFGDLSGGLRKLDPIWWSTLVKSGVQFHAPPRDQKLTPGTPSRTPSGRGPG